jgi:L-malate glycosyltransferase
MRVLHLNNEKTWRGGERQTLLLAAALQELGITNTIGCRPGTPLYEQASRAGLPVVAVSGNPLLAPVQIAAAARRFDLLHCHTGRAHSFAALVASFVPKPVVITRRVGFLPRPSWFNRRKYRQLAKAVCVSRFVADQLQQWGVAAGQLQVIHDGLPAPGPGRARAELRRALGVREDALVVGHVGALEIEKDHDTFLRAIQAIAGQHPALQVVVIGDGRRRAELEALRDRLGLEQVVRFTGALPEASEYLPAFDVFVLSSVVEGFPNVILEAFAANVPVVATAAGGTGELVRDGDTGLLVPVGDAAALGGGIARVLGDAALRQRCPAAARARWQAEFSVAHMAQCYAALYREICPV